LKPAPISAALGYKPPDVEVVLERATVLPFSCFRPVIGELLGTQIPAVYVSGLPFTSPDAATGWALASWWASTYPRGPNSPIWSWPTRIVSISATYVLEMISCTQLGPEIDRERLVRGVKRGAGVAGLDRESNRVMRAARRCRRARGGRAVGGTRRARRLRRARPTAGKQDAGQRQRDGGGIFIGEIPPWVGVAGKHQRRLSTC
jgi:hypothetical protein